MCQKHGRSDSSYLCLANVRTYTVWSNIPNNTFIHFAIEQFRRLSRYLVLFYVEETNKKKACPIFPCRCKHLLYSISTKLLGLSKYIFIVSSSNRLRFYFFIVKFLNHLCNLAVTSLPELTEALEDVMFLHKKLKSGDASFLPRTLNLNRRWVFSLSTTSWTFSAPKFNWI